MSRLFSRIFTSNKRSKGSVAVAVLAVAAVVLEFGAAALYVTSSGMTRSKREEKKVVGLHLAEAGIHKATDYLAYDFMINQNFDFLDMYCDGASEASPTVIAADSLGTNGAYSAAIIDYDDSDYYRRNVTMLSVGWIDSDGDNMLDDDEPRRAIRTVITYSLERAKVFDYAYFLNNYGWFYGFTSTSLVVNGDIRANGNVEFSTGGTVNGSIYACPNSKLSTPAAGNVIGFSKVNQWSNSTYESNASSRSRQAYDSAIHGARESDEYEKWWDIIYDEDGDIYGDDYSGAVVGDKDGTRTFDDTLLNTDPTKELPMPDLGEISRYEHLSTNYVDQKAAYGDGTPNPHHGEGAWLEVWDPGAGAYTRVSDSNGVVNGSVGLIGDSTHPIKIHGPVTITGDVAIKGKVQGQGTLYTGRNVHVVGNIEYSDPPDFTGTDPEAIDNSNEKKSLLGLAARGSIIYGNSSQWYNPNGNPLKYMRPPFTKERLDDFGNTIPAFDYSDTDEWGMQKHKSLLGDSYINSISENISQIDAVMYTNNMTGGVTGAPLTVNGSVISKDEAIVLGGGLKMNYDNRIKERSLNGEPLIDIDLPRAPAVYQLTWQEVYN